MKNEHKNRSVSSAYVSLDQASDVRNVDKVGPKSVKRFARFTDLKCKLKIY